MKRRKNPLNSPIEVGVDGDVDEVLYIASITLKRNIGMITRSVNMQEKEGYQ